MRTDRRPFGRSVVKVPPKYLRLDHMNLSFVVLLICISWKTTSATSFGVPSTFHLLWRSSTVAMAGKNWGQESGNTSSSTTPNDEGNGQPTGDLMEGSRSFSAGSLPPPPPLQPALSTLAHEMIGDSTHPWPPPFPEQEQYHNGPSLPHETWAPPHHPPQVEAQQGAFPVGGDVLPPQQTLFEQPPPPQRPPAQQQQPRQRQRRQQQQQRKQHPLPPPQLHYDQQQLVQYEQHVMLMQQELDRSFYREQDLLHQVNNLTASVAQGQQREELHTRQMDVLTERVMEVEAAAAMERNRLLELQANCTAQGRRIATLQGEVDTWKARCQEYVDQHEQDEKKIEQLITKQKEAWGKAEDLAALVERHRLQEEEEEVRRQVRVRRKRRRNPSLLAWLLGWTDDDEEQEEKDWEEIREAARSSLLEALQRERDNVEELETTVHDLQLNQSALMEQLESSDQLQEELNERLTTLEEEKTVLKAALRQLRKEMKVEFSKGQKLVDELTQTRNEVTKLNQEIESLMATHQKELQSLRNTIGKRDAALTEKESNLTTVRAYVDRLEERLADFAVARRDIEMRERKCLEIERSASDAIQERDRLRAAMDRLDREHEEIKTLLEQLAQDRSRLHSENKKLEIQNQNLLRDRQAIQISVEATQQELTAFKAGKESMEARLQEMEAQLQESGARNDQLLLQINQTLAEREQLRRQMEGLVFDQRELREMLDQAETTKLTLEGKLEELHGTLVTVNLEKEGLEQELLIQKNRTAVLAAKVQAAIGAQKIADSRERLGALQTKIGINSADPPSTRQGGPTSKAEYEKNLDSSQVNSKQGRIVRDTSPSFRENESSTTTVPTSDPRTIYENIVPNLDQNEALLQERSQLETNRTFSMSIPTGYLNSSASTVQKSTSVNTTRPHPREGIPGNTQNLTSKNEHLQHELLDLHIGRQYPEARSSQEQQRVPLRPNVSTNVNTAMPPTGKDIAGNITDVKTVKRTSMNGPVEQEPLGSQIGRQSPSERLNQSQQRLPPIPDVHTNVNTARPPPRKDTPGNITDATRQSRTDLNEQLAFPISRATPSARLSPDQQELRREKNATFHADPKSTPGSSTRLQTPRPMVNVKFGRGPHNKTAIRPAHQANSTTSERLTRKDSLNVTSQRGVFAQNFGGATRRPPPPRRPLTNRTTLSLMKNQTTTFKRPISPTNTSTARLPTPVIAKRTNGIPTRATNVTRKVPFRTVRKFFSKTTGLHGFFTPSSSKPQTKTATPRTISQPKPAQAAAAKAAAKRGIASVENSSTSKLSDGDKNEPRNPGKGVVLNATSMPSRPMLSNPQDAQSVSE